MGSGAVGGYATPLWRALVAFRLATLVYAVGLVLHGYRDLARPGAAAAALVAMAAWTAAMSVANSLERTRRWSWCLADLAVATAMLLLTVYVDGGAGLLVHGFTLTGPWAAAPVLSCAVLGGTWAGLGASLVIVAATIALPGGWFDADTVDNLVLLVLAAAAVGLVVRLLKRAEHQLRQLVEREAATAERDRLARSIHDGVLQVLSLIQREGPELGRRGGELARLAGAQETALRSLVAGDQHRAVPGVKDLRVLLAGVAVPAVELVVPATAVLLPGPVADELVAAVGAALDNVARHAGPQARAWVLVEDETGELVVTVRDDGPGIAEGRLAAAAAEGRLGVAQSMRGRVADLGGTTTIASHPGAGTEVEFRIPRR